MFKCLSNNKEKTRSVIPNIIGYFCPNRSGTKYLEGVYSQDEVKQPCWYFKCSEGVFESLTVFLTGAWCIANAVWQQGYNIAWSRKPTSNSYVFLGGNWTILSSAVAYWLHMQTDTTTDDCISTGVLRNTMAVCIVYFDVYYSCTYHSYSDTIRIMFVICFVCTKLMWSL